MHYIIIDGLDASGKSTQAKLLTSFLRKRGRNVFLRMHPSGDCFFGKKAKQYLELAGKSAHFCSAFFYMCDVIRSILLYVWRKFDYIVFVRYLMGTAYLPSPLDKIGYYFFSYIVPTSNVMFFLDVTPTEAYKRNLLRGAPPEMFENLRELEKIRKKALALALENEWIIINADKTREEVQQEIRQHITNFTKFDAPSLTSY
jgi:dTMP kinase